MNCYRCHFTMDTYALLGCFVIIFLFLLLDTRRPNKYPPGPTWLPIVGNLLLVESLRKKYKYLHLVWSHMKECYGPLVGVRMGKERMVFIFGKDLIRELAAKEEFEGRPNGFVFRLRTFGKKLGVVFTDGATGLEQRKFFLKHLREIGFVRSRMVENITKETTYFISCLRKKMMDGPVDIESITKIFTVNSLWCFLAGKRLSETDVNRINKLLILIHDTFKITDMSGGLLNQMPFIRFIAPEKSKYNHAVRIAKTLTEFLKETVDEHKNTFDPKNIRDFTDAFLLQQQKLQNNQGSFKDEQLICSLLDILMAGSDTINTTITFAVIYLIKNPQIQKRVQDELDSVVGRDRWPSLQDRPNLHYLEAMLMELYRKTHIGQISVPHRAKTNVSVGDFIIPKDTTVIFSLFDIHMDKNEWGDPETFRPERFLNDKGDCIKQCDALVAFGSGRRRCIGETFAKMSVFLFVTALLHNFNVSSPPGMPPPSTDPIDGAILTAQPFPCLLTPRSN